MNCKVSTRKRSWPNTSKIDIFAQKVWGKPLLTSHKISGVSVDIGPPVPPKHISPQYNFYARRDISVGIATGYCRSTEGPSSSLCRVKLLLFSTASRQDLGPIKFPNERIQGAYSLGLKQQRREADGLPVTSGEVNKTCIYTSTYSLIRLHGVVLNYLSTGTILSRLNVISVPLLVRNHVNTLQFQRRFLM
jgi:hypothetical protein